MVAAAAQPRLKQSWESAKVHAIVTTVPNAVLTFETSFGKQQTSQRTLVQGSLRDQVVRAEAQTHNQEQTFDAELNMFVFLVC